MEKNRKSGKDNLIDRILTDYDYNYCRDYLSKLSIRKKVISSPADFSKYVNESNISKYRIAQELVERKNNNPNFALDDAKSEVYRNTRRPSKKVIDTFKSLLPSDTGTGIRTVLILAKTISVHTVLANYGYTIGSNLEYFLKSLSGTALSNIATDIEFMMDNLYFSCGDNPDIFDVYENTVDSLPIESIDFIYINHRIIMKNYTYIEYIVHKLSNMCENDIHEIYKTLLNKRTRGKNTSTYEELVHLKYSPIDDVPEYKKREFIKHLPSEDYNIYNLLDLILLLTKADNIGWKTLLQLLSHYGAITDGKRVKDLLSLNNK